MNSFILSELTVVDANNTPIFKMSFGERNKTAAKTLKEANEKMYNEMAVAIMVAGKESKGTDKIDPLNYKGHF